MNKLSVIVPCYNEEESLPLFYKECSKVLDNMVFNSIAGDCAANQCIDKFDYEYIFVDDGSSDKTLNMLKDMSKNNERCRYIAFSRNFGKEAGMYAGLSEASGDFCVLMDADLQHPPFLLPEMYRVVTEEGYDCCGGLRKGRSGDGAVRSFLSRAFYRVCSSLTHMEMTDGHGDFRMMSRTMVNAILEMKEYNRYMKGLFSFVGFDTKWIEFENVERTYGQTKWNFKNLFAYALEGIISFSTAPLKFAGLIGMILFMGALILMGTNLIQSIWVPSAISSLDIIITVLLLLGSLQMLFMYILGAYLSKDYLENKNRPIYIVKDRK